MPCPGRTGASTDVFVVLFILACTGDLKHQNLKLASSLEAIDSVIADGATLATSALHDDLYDHHPICKWC